MKQSINPLYAGICILIALAVIVFIGMHFLSPHAAPPPPEQQQKPPKPATIFGHPVPNNVPYDYMQHPPQGAPGYRGASPPMGTPPGR